MLEVPDWGWHLDLDLDMVINLAWIIPEVFITLRSVKAQIQSVKFSLVLRFQLAVLVPVLVLVLVPSCGFT